jgi:hypothetical protein
MPWSSESSSAAFSWDFPWASRPWLSCPRGTTGSKAKGRQRRRGNRSTPLLPSPGLTVGFRPGRRSPEYHACLPPLLPSRDQTEEPYRCSRSRASLIQGAMICRAMLMGLAEPIPWPWTEIMEPGPNESLLHMNQRFSPGFPPDKHPKSAGSPNISCTNGHLEAPQPISGGGQDGHDCLFRRTMHRCSLGIIFINAVGLLPGQKPGGGSQPNQAEGYSQLEPQERSRACL